MIKQKTVMSIGGSDPSGGAGIQTDLKAFNLLGLHGTTTITSITVQNTQQVSRVQPLSTDLIEEQIDALMQDFDIQTVKTGLLCNNDIISLVGKKTKEYNWTLIVDPVLGATTGDQLADIKEINTLQTNLLPQSFLITPNLHEAETLTNTSIKSIKDMKEAAVQLKEMGATHVLIKGGHLQTKQAKDLLYDGKQYHQYSLPFIPEKKAHGSGCTLSALITSYLALGKNIADAVNHSKHLLWQMIQEGFFPGKGVDILSTSPPILQHAPRPMSSIEHFKVWHLLQQSIKHICTELPLLFVPEVGINIGYALPNATTADEICALNGRIIKKKNGVPQCGQLCYGGSKHIASIILAAMNQHPTSRSAMNIRYTKENLSYCEQTDLTLASFHRADQPETIDSTMEWGTTQAIQNQSTIPDLIFDLGSIGKEPMIRIIANDPKHLLEKLRSIIQKTKQ